MLADRLYKARDFVFTIGATTSVADAAVDLETLASHYGFSIYVLATFTGPGSITAPFIVTTCWEDEWHRRYIEQKYAMHDPTIARASRSHVPFLWSETRTDPGVTDRSLQVLDEAAEFKLNDGVFIPIFGPSGLEGTLAFGGEKVDLDPDDLKALHLAGFSGYNHVRELALGPQANVSFDPALTNREMECLKWSAEGKTSSDIADVLGISRHTADWYLKEATRKLGASNRTHAVATAFRRKLIS